MDHTHEIIHLVASGSIRGKIPPDTSLGTRGGGGDEGRNQCPFRARTRLLCESVRGKVRSPYNQHTHLLFVFHDSIPLFAANLNSRFVPKNLGSR